MDFSGPLKSKYLLVAVDAYSKWLEVFIMDSMTARETEEKFKMLFARWGFSNRQWNAIYRK